jgi:hypothetical protein
MVLMCTNCSSQVDEFWRRQAFIQEVRLTVGANLVWFLDLIFYE